MGGLQTGSLTFRQVFLRLSEQPLQAQLTSGCSHAHLQLLLVNTNDISFINRAFFLLESSETSDTFDKKNLMCKWQYITHIIAIEMRALSL